MREREEFIMKKLFVDTNAFEKEGYIFDNSNPVTNTIIKNVNNNEYEFCIISIIDSEIISHIKKRCDEEYQQLAKRKWLQAYISDEDLKYNCNKKLIDYEQFKNKVAAKYYDVSDVNPEIIFKKYFNIEYPFENRDEKRKEFPDAFISERLNGLVQSTEDEIYFVTEDKGLKSSLDSRIICYNDLKSFLSSINHVSPKLFEKMGRYIIKSIKDIQLNMMSKIIFELNDVDDESLEIEDLEISNIINIKVIDNDKDTYYVSCKCATLNLFGNFVFNTTRTCVNNYGELIDIEPDFLEVTNLSKDNFEFIIKIIDLKKDKFSIEYLDKYVFNLTNEMIENSYYNSYEDYIEAMVE